MYVNGIREIKFNDIPNDKYSDMINSVIGQLSDGIWENNSRLSGYYIFTDGTNDGMTIKLLEHNPTPQYYRKINKYYKNPYYSMSDIQVLRYFANKIKEIALIELKDMYEQSIYDKMVEPKYNVSWFRGTETEIAECNRQHNIAKSYIEEHPFDKNGKFIPNDDCILTYLSYKKPITLTDAYNFYKLLIGLCNKKCA